MLLIWVSPLAVHEFIFLLAAISHPSRSDSQAGWGRRPDQLLIPLECARKRCWTPTDRESLIHFW